MDPQNPTTEMLLWAYSRGIFPMAEPRTGRLDFYSPDPRAIFPLDGLHVSHSLARVLRSGRFEVRSDSDFESVIRACAERSGGRQSTWLDERLIGLYVKLHEIGHAHSIEAWRDEKLVGGLYGVHIGAAFCGESMFHRSELGGTDASKVCLFHLVEHLRVQGFALLDTQFTTPHLERLGCIEVRRTRYMQLLREALKRDAPWGTLNVEDALARARR